MFSTDYFEPWKQFRDPLVRQLAFAIASPNLIHHFPKEIIFQQDISLHTAEQWVVFYHGYLPRLQQLDQEPSDLYKFLARIKSTRLGLRFEALLWFWLQDPANQYYHLLGHSIQTHHAGKTLGEIDFLIENKQTGQTEHWEVCLKYYLAEADLGLFTWIGLNPEDTFAHKLNHLTQKQFQFQQALGYLIEKRYAVIKGQLYLPEQHAHYPDWLNTERRLGKWSDAIPHTSSWRRLTRQEWLCPHHDVLPDQSSHQSIVWWTDGLYYHPIQEHYLMLRFERYSNVFKVYS